MTITAMRMEGTAAPDEERQGEGDRSPFHLFTFSPFHLRLEEVRQRFEEEARRGVCDTGRYRCRYYVWGEGPPLVFIPGLADDALSFVLPITLLSEHFRCVA